MITLLRQLLKTCDELRSNEVVMKGRVEDDQNFLAKLDQVMGILERLDF